MAVPKKSKHSNPFHRKTDDITPDLTYPVRLNKYVARCGVASRRKAVDLIKVGKVRVNDQVILEPYHLVNEKDIVKLEGKKLIPEVSMIYILLNKPKDVISTTSDERDRKTILDIINFEGKERLFPVGRLDRNTTGLILLTNDGDLAKKLSHPSHKVQKKYKVSLDKPISEADFDRIKQGIVLEDGPATVSDLQIINPLATEITLTIVIGRNRIVRRIFESLGYFVKYLDRVYYAGLTKKGLPRGNFRLLTPREVIMLKHFI
jgi:23S rRNA pseudouridine2605 synthase